MMGYSREGDVVTLTMSISDYHALLVSLGMAAGQVSDDRRMLRTQLALSNRLNAGNPAWTPYDTGEEAHVD
jgi:hypothetical protein